MQSNGCRGRAIQGFISKDTPSWENILQNVIVGGIYEMGMMQDRYTWKAEEMHRAGPDQQPSHPVQAPSPVTQGNDLQLTRWLIAVEII